MSWYAFDLDGTLALDEGSYTDHIGPPILKMVALVKDHLAAGREVRIVTARVAPEWGESDNQRTMIEAWCEKHIGVKLVVQAHKNGGMVVLYDDRAIGVQHNTGVLIQQPGYLDHDITVVRIKRAFFDHTGVQMDPATAERIAREVARDQ